MRAHTRMRETRVHCCSAGLPGLMRTLRCWHDAQSGSKNASHCCAGRLAALGRASPRSSEGHAPASSSGSAAGELLRGALTW